MWLTARAWAKLPNEFENGLVSGIPLGTFEPARGSANEGAPRTASHRSEPLDFPVPKGLTAGRLLGALLGRDRFILHLDAPPDPRRLWDRFLIRHAEVIVVPDDDVAMAVIRAGASPHVVVSRQAWDPGIFADIPPHRGVAEAHRLVFSGELSPFGGPADLQFCAALWAEHHPEREIDITWVGDGDLRAVLDAQPLPANMRQRFTGPLSGPSLAGVFGECGLLVVPHLTGTHSPPLREAAAAGLPVIGSSRDRLVRNMLVQGQTGWLFDPLQPRSMFEILDYAMSVPVDDLNEMRVTAQAWARMPWPRRVHAAAPAGMR
jgi:glycosyltransferase involved in cell wall biosynthesis